MFGSWKGETDGTTAFIFAVMLPILLLLGGIALDQSAIQSQRARIQNIADDGALYAVREMEIVRNDERRIEEVALAYVYSFDDIPDLTANVQIDLPDKTVDVTVSASPQTYFANPLGMASTMRVKSTAQLVGQAGNTCLIALDEETKFALALNQRSELTARNCALYANSTSPESLTVLPRAQIVVSDVFLVGGYIGSLRGISATPVTDAPPIVDPLAGRPAPNYSGCDHIERRVTTDTTLEPGVYCGGLEISGARATLEPGIYIIENGTLSVNNDGWILGNDVGFYLTGMNAKLNFDEDSHIDLTAPRTGALTGLLFFADANNPKTMRSRGRGAPPLRDGHVIRSNDARRLVGTIYLPDDKLVVDGETPVADESEYTVIVAQSFELYNGPNLVIQTDYTASDVPVPEGVGPNNATSAVLVR